MCKGTSQVRSRSPMAQIFVRTLFLKCCPWFFRWQDVSSSWHALFLSSQHGLDVCFICGRVIHACLCVWPRFPQSLTLSLSTFPSHFPCVIFNGVEFIQVMRVEFVPGFYQPCPGARVGFSGLGRGSARFVGRFCTLIEFSLQGLFWLVSRQLGRAIERGSHISGLC